MLAFPEMLTHAAEQAGMAVPNFDENKDWNPEEYPHFTVFCNIQLGRPMRPGEHWDNAKVIAQIPEDRIRQITLEEMIGMGLHIIT